MKTPVRLTLVSVALAAMFCIPTAQAQYGRQANAIYLRDSAKAKFLTYHYSGVSAPTSTARANICDTAKCLRAQTSWYSDVGTTYVWLHSGMLSTMKTMVTSYGYSYLCSALAGSDHSSGSYHYRGTAYDIAVLNGRGISASNPYWRTFNQRNRDRGAVESLGPGYPGHDTHLHNAWPSGTSSSAAGGCITEVSAPSYLNATTVDADSIKLTWRDNSSIESNFKVQRSGTSGTGPWTTVATLGANATSYTCNGLGSGKKYWFRVQAYNSYDSSPWSNVDNATTKDVKPNAPSALTATAVSNDQINLAWTDNSGNEDGFKIYRSTDGTTFAAIKAVGINVRSYSNTGLTGNKKYYYRVTSYNTAGNSAYSNTASDTTAPQPPSNLTVSAVAGTANWNRLQLAWTDNSGSEVGFKVERATASAGPFSQIATTGAGVANYQDSGLAASMTYYYRVRSYNANGNSDYSAVASRATGNAPPILNPIGNKTVNAGSLLAFTCTSSDPNAPAASTAWTGTFEGTTSGTQEQMFRDPINSASTTQFLDTAASHYSTVLTGVPSGMGGSKAVKLGWTFKTGNANFWLRVTTAGAPSYANPTIALDQKFQMKFYSGHTFNVGIGVRETSTTAAYGADGGTSGTVEWVGVTNSIGGVPIPNRTVPLNTATTLAWNIPFEPQFAFTGDGKVLETGAKGTLEHIIIQSSQAGCTGGNIAWLDDISVVTCNYRTFSLDAGAPAGAAISRRSGKFTWTPTTAQAGVFNVTIRVTDNLGAQDYETIKVTVVGTGNAAPVLNAIGSKTVNEGSTLAFTATATDANPGQTMTYSLGAGAPSGASITTAGAFSWTPTETQGPGSYPITVRVTDNGSPVSNDFETITVTVNEVNTAPVMAAIADQVANEQQAFTLTPSATDADAPAQALTWSLVSGPEGMTVNPGTGMISWTPTEADGPDTNQVTIRVTDNGSPKLSAEKTFNIGVNEVNVAPTLAIGATAITGVNIADFEKLADGSYNGTVMFRQPLYSSSTTNFLDATPNVTYVTDTFPEGVPGARSLAAQFSFKSGTTNPWLRLTTYNLSLGNAIPNPIIDITKKLRFKIYSDRSIKVAIGVRETNPTGAIGADGGCTGAMEWLGATLNGSSPNPSRVVDPTNWTTLEFDIPTEVVAAFPGSGSGILESTTGKAVLEHLAIVPNDGPGVYNLYLDNFEIMVPTTNFVVDTGKLIAVNCTATDPDDPKQALTFTLEPDAPTNAIIDSKTGTIEWTPTPEQSPSTAVFGVRVTDDGTPALSDVKTVTINVNKVNTAPRFVYYFKEFFINPGEPFTFDATADDDDIPADTLTYSLVEAPAGATYDSTNGMFAWTPTTANGTNYAVVRATDNGVPPLFDEMKLVIVVSPTNGAPTLSLSTARVTEPVVTFETFTNATPTEQVMFKKPGNSATTSSFVDTAVTNYTTVTTVFPAGNANTGAKALRASWSFKTGTTGYWVRLTTANTTLLPNPTINAGARVKFDIHTDKALKVCLGIRETGTTAENGANGGTTGPIEWVGATSVVSGCPQATRTVNAGAWTTLEFDLPNDPKVAFTGDGVLTNAQAVLENLALIGAGGTGVYNVYLDNFQVVTTTALPGAVAMKSGSTLTFTASGTDPEAQALTFGLEEGAPAGAVINAANGAFTWTPTSDLNGTTNDITIYVQDSPPGGCQTKRDAQVVSVAILPDTLAPQSAAEAVAAGEAISMEWNAIPGVAYQVQYQENGSTQWVNVGVAIIASDSVETVVLRNTGGQRLYRIIEISGTSAE